jgi:hypothetical protein
MKRIYENYVKLVSDLMKSNNPRQTYLLETLGLSHDPFASPVAEQELYIVGDEQKPIEADTADAPGESKKPHQEPQFFSYYIDHQAPQLHKPILAELREARNGLIFGRPGSGKTTLRYILGAECRVVPDRTLVVTYELGDKIEHPPAVAEHWAKIAAELAIDLFIQVIEQFETLRPPTAWQIQELKDQMRLVWLRLRRTVVLMMENDYSRQSNGLATLWPRLNRPATHYVAQSPNIKQLIEACLPIESSASTSLSGIDLLEAGLAAAKAWGFKQIFVLVDGVDGQEREVANMLNLIKPLLDHLALWQAQDLFFYFFLPEEMQPPTAEAYSETWNKLPYPPLSYPIKWDKNMMLELLHQRLRAAGSRLPGLNALASVALENKLEDYLIQAAQNSPRRLLRLVSALIDAHAQSEPDHPLITPEDWQRLRQNWSYGPPEPPEFMANGSAKGSS